MTGCVTLKRTQLLVVAVNYGSDEQALAFLSSLRPVLEAGSACVVLVDNTPRQEPGDLARKIAAMGDTVHYLPSSRNLGYLGGARYGIEWSSGNAGRFDWLVVCNVDLCVETTDVCSVLAELEKDAGIGVVAPSIRSSKTGIDMNPFQVKRPRSVVMHAYAKIFRFPLTANIYRTGSFLWRRMKRIARAVTGRQREGAETAASQMDIYAPHGSCMAFSARYFGRGADLDYPMFLFGEEIYVGERAASVGLRVVYEPRIRLVHDEHASTGFWRPPQMCRYSYDSARYLADTFFRKPA